MVEAGQKVYQAKRGNTWKYCNTVYTKYYIIIIIHKWPKESKAENALHSTCVAPFKTTQAASTGIWERKTQDTWRVFQQRLIWRHELWFLDDSNRSRCIKIQKDLSCFACIPSCCGANKLTQSPSGLVRVQLALATMSWRYQSSSIACR